MTSVWIVNGRRIVCTSNNTAIDCDDLALMETKIEYQKYRIADTCTVKPVLKGHIVGLRKSGLIRQLTSQNRFNSYEIFYDRST